jgi:hypothetical protein
VTSASHTVSSSRLLDFIMPTWFALAAAPRAGMD